MGKHDGSFGIKRVVGSWKSKGAEDLGNGTFGTREFGFTEDSWKLRFTLYGDADLKYPVFAFGAEGEFQVESPSSVVKGAYNALFGFSKKTLTLLTSDEQIINSLGFGGCGLQVGVEKDISISGCSFMKSVKDYDREYDLLDLDEGSKVLCLGARPADGDMSTEAKRPTALGYPLIRA
ncbi:MAG: hypothetical protein HQL03_00185 [Nitrospirae bacterium]|nr:hypothetical protein [Nitrospirota bacterium]MBF0591157.1 hypothetical protein [Nitrospirota bacterium]